MPQYDSYEAVCSNVLCIVIEMRKYNQDINRLVYEYDICG